MIKWASKTFWICWPICVVIGDLASAQVPIRTIARSVQQASGVSIGTTYGSIISGPVINDAGQVIFTAGLSGAGVDSSNNGAIYSSFGGTTSLIARKGDLAPGDEPNARLGEFYAPEAAGTGQVAFQALLTNSTHTKGVYSNTAGSLQPLARAGDPAPGAGTGVIYANFGNHYTNQSGKTTFAADVNVPGQSTQSGVWTNRSGPVQLLALSGTAAPGFSTGTWGGFSEAVINQAGTVAFTAGISTNGRAVYRSDAQGSFAIVVKSGDQIPGLPAGSRFNSLGPVNINSTGKVAFKGDILGGSGGSAVYSQGSGTLQVVARSSTPAPGTPAGVNFGEFINSRSPQSDPVISATGDISFAAFVNGTGVNTNNDGGIWTQHSGSLSLVAREGSQPPGMASGSSFTSLVDRPTINAIGQTAFMARAVSPTSGGFGVWATDPSGNLKGIAFPGMQIEVSPGVFGTVLNAYGLFDWVTAENGGLCGFNSAGQLAFWAEFKEPGIGQGVFVATVPEPNSVLMLVFGSVAICFLKRPHRESGT